MLKEAQNDLQIKDNKTNKKKVSTRKKAIVKTENKLERLDQELTILEKQQPFLSNELLEIKANYRHSGLSKKERTTQYKKKRKRNATAYKRKQELNSSTLNP